MIRSNRWPSSRTGRLKAFAATSASPRPGMSQYAAIEAVLLREKPDFVQIDYSLDDREAEKRILPAAAEVKAGVLTALPFGRARLFRAVRGKELPDWARGFADSWAQFFLKYLLADPRVTAVIPGTADAAHMTDNAGAMRGPLPDPDQRRQMVAFADAPLNLWAVQRRVMGITSLWRYSRYSVAC